MSKHWISTDPALGEYIPKTPVNKEAKRYNQNLPGMGGVFNTVNLNLYHYAGNNPVKYTDPDGNSVFVGAAIAVWSVNAVLLTFGVLSSAVPSKTEHYNRNQYQKTETYSRLEDALAHGYERLGYKEGGEENAESMDRYHEMGTLPDNYPQPSENNKYVKADPNNPGASFELVFDKNGDLVTDSINGGTYNFSDPKGVKGKINHFLKDMVPYYIWGNSETDAKTTSFFQRIFGNYKGEIPDPAQKE